MDENTGTSEDPQWTDSSGLAGETTDPAIPAPRRGPAERPGHGEGLDLSISRFQLFGVMLFAAASFFFFLAMKLPEARIQNLVIAHLRILAQEQGFLFSAEKVKIGLLLGPSVKLYNVELKSLENEHQSLKIAYLKVSPRLLSMLTSVKKVGVSAELLDGSLSGYVGASSTGSFAVDLSLDSIDLGATNLLKKLLPIDLAAKIDGSIALNFDGTQVQNSDGQIKLKIEKVAIPSQPVVPLGGIVIPKIGISEININLLIASGQFTVKELEVGKDGGSDDLVGKLTGEGTLNRMLERSTVSAKASFGLSASLKKAFPFVDAVLGNARQPDGKYAYRITGALSSLEAQPGQ